MKVYAHNKPSIVMEGSKGFAYFSGELEAYNNNGLVAIHRKLHGNEVIEAGKSYLEFTDKNGNSFGNLEQTIEALNDIFNTDNNIETNSIIDLDAHIISVVQANFNINIL